jgi:hypothetical protein
LNDRWKWPKPSVMNAAAGDVTFLHVPTVAGGKLVRLAVEVAQKCEDGIFRRADKYTLHKEAEDVLRTLRELADAMNPS